MGLVRAVLVTVAAFVSLVCFGQTSYSASGLLAADSAKAERAESLPTGPTHYDITIVKTYPHDPEAFTQGLVYSDGFLYESTGAYQSASTLRKVDLETGKVLKDQTLPRQYFGEGLTLWRETLIQLTWRSGIGFVYERDTFQKVDEFQYKGEGWGITHDGKSLVMSDGSAVLRFLDPESYQEMRQVVVLDEHLPIRNLNELEYIKGKIFANIWQKDTIAMVSPENGKVLGWIDLSSLRNALGPVQKADALNGIAYDAVRDRIFVTGKLWPKLFEIKLVPR